MDARFVLSITLEDGERKSLQRLQKMLGEATLEGTVKRVLGMQLLREEAGVKRLQNKDSLVRLYDENEQS